ncbi:hypothetical protein ACFE04_010317 [Oxalis oulophora]
MDSETKLVPEKSHSFVSRGDDDNPDKGVVPDEGTENPDQSSKLGNVDDSEDPEKKHEDNPDEADKQEDNPEEKAEEPPEIVHTVESTWKDVDEFLTAALPALKDENEAQKEEDKSEPVLEPEDNDLDEKSTHKTIELPSFIEKFVDLVEEKVANRDSTEGKGKFGQDPEEDQSLFDSISRLASLYESLKDFATDPIHGLMLNRISAIHQRAMSFFEDEFRAILDDYKIAELDQSNNAGGDSNSDQPDEQNPDQPAPEGHNYPGYSDESVLNMNKIAKEMIKGGHEFECYEIFIFARRTVIDESLNNFSGFEKVSIDEVQRMPWESLEKEITIWCKTFKQCATIFFTGEHKLVNAVFKENHSMISETLFSNMTRGIVIQLLNFAEAMAISKRSIEKLFKILDMYEGLRDNAIVIDELFPEQCANELKTEMTTAKTRLGEAAILIYGDLETSIKNDQGKTPVASGAVHPLTRYTLNYLRFSCDQYNVTLEQIFKEHSKIERADSTSRPRFQEGESENPNNQTNNQQAINQEAQTPFTCQLIRVMDLLDANLDAKAKLYKDTTLSCIFMMNNGRYILQKIKGSPEAYQKLGDTWCRKRSSELRNYHKTYQRDTWTKLLGCLTHEGLMDRGKIVKPNLKERFKNFNIMFDEIHRTQSTWVVSDEQLKSELRVSISAVVIPAYRSFMGRFSQYLDPGRQTEKYIKYQADDIEEALDELFEGNPATMLKRKSPFKALPSTVLVVQHLSEAMGSSFNPSILMEKLTKLNNSQASIESILLILSFFDFVIFIVFGTNICGFLIMNSRRKGADFVGEFWKVLPDALRDIVESGDVSGKNAALRLISIWDERKVFGSRGQILKEEFAGKSVDNKSNRNGKLNPGLKLKQPAGNTVDKLVSGYQLLYSGQVDEDAILSRCRNAITYLEKVDKEIGADGNPEQFRGPTVEEIQVQHSVLKDSIEHLTAIESSRASLVTSLREALQEQEMKLHQVRGQIQAAHFRVEHTSDIYQQLSNNTQKLPAEISSKQTPSSMAQQNYVPVEQSAPVMYAQQVPFPEKSGLVEEDSQKLAAAVMAAKLTASASSAQMLSYVFSSLASEAANSNPVKEASGDFPPEKRPKLEKPQQPQFPPFNYSESQQYTPSEPPPPLPSSPPPPTPLPPSMPPYPEFIATVGPPYTYNMVQLQQPGYQTVVAPITGVSPYPTQPQMITYQGFQGSESSFYAQPSSMPTAPVSRQ